MKSHKQQLEDLHKLSNRQIIEYTNIASVSAKTLNDDFVERTLKIKEHVENQYNVKGKVVKVSLQQRNGLRSQYYISHDRIKDGGLDFEEYVVCAHGEQNSLNYLFSLLHEVGHLVDFNKRGIAVAFEGGGLKEIEKEIKAWIYGFKFGLTFGYMAKEEVETGFADAMSSMLTYYKYYNIHLDEFLMDVEAIRKEVLG